jgi:hypothetical protein
MSPSRWRSAAAGVLAWCRCNARDAACKAVGAGCGIRTWDLCRTSAAVASVSHAARRDSNPRCTSAPASWGAATTTKNGARARVAPCKKGCGGGAGGGVIFAVANARMRGGERTRGGACACAAARQWSRARAPVPSSRGAGRMRPREAARAAAAPLAGRRARRRRGRRRGRRRWRWGAPPRRAPLDLGPSPHRAAARNKPAAAVEDGDAGLARDGELGSAAPPSTPPMGHNTPN